MMTEEELKLAVHDGFELPELADPGLGVATVEPRPPRTLRATYYDTADLRLAREGITARYRTGEGAPAWQVKLPVVDGDPNERMEIQLRGRAGAPPADVLELLTPWSRGAEISPVTVLRTVRLTWLLHDAAGAELAEVVDDTVSVLHGGRPVGRFREIEVERRAIDRAGLHAIGARLVAAGARDDGLVPKAVRALGPRAAAPADLPRPGTVGRKSSAADLVTHALRTHVRRLLVCDAAVRRAQPDAVHQMRVACRRLRSVLRTFRALVDQAWAGELRADLKWLADALGGPRDLEVLRAGVAEIAVADPLAPLDASAVGRVDEALARREAAALGQLTAVLRSPRYVALTDRLVAAAREPRLTGSAGAPAVETLPGLVASAWRPLAKRCRKLTQDADDQRWHEARIRAKRARYAAEAATPALGKPASRLAAAAERLQNLLGAHQDAVVAAAAMLELAAEATDDPALEVTCGRLAERERAAARAARGAFPQVWRKAGRPRNTRWLP